MPISTLLEQINIVFLLTANFINIQPLYTKQNHKHDYKQHPLTRLPFSRLRPYHPLTRPRPAATRPLLDPLLSSHPSSLHILIFPEPEIQPSSHPLISKVVSTQKLFDPIVNWFKSHPSPPAAIVSDFFLGWTAELATHLGIRRVVFSPSGALGSSIFHNLWREVVNINAGKASGDDNFLVSFPEIPNSPEFRWWQLSKASRYYKTGDPDFEAFRKGMLANMTSWGMIYNTFEELEGVYIDYVKKQMGHDRVCAVGLLLPDEHGPNSTRRGGSSAVPPDKLLRWLDKKPNDSVVYICFGSRFMLSEKQMTSLASALELSNVNFILCAKESDSSFVPSGFEDRVLGRGFVVKGWAPQLVILTHQAVGSFVTHCGWNSTLEGVAAGVMMLAWPMGADQFANAKLLVDQSGVAQRVCDGGPESVLDSVKLAWLLDRSLSGDISERVKVRQLSQAAIKAVNEGTSVRDLNMFVNLVSELKNHQTNG